MSHPMTAPGAMRSWPPRRWVRSQTCQPSTVCGRFSLAGQSGQGPAQAAQYPSPPPKDQSARARRRFFLIQHQAAGDVLRLEGFEDRPDFEEGVDPGRADGDEVARFVADTFPIQNRAAGDGLGHSQRHVLLAGGFRQAVDGRIGAGGDHQRGGERGHEDAQAGQQVQPFGPVRQVQSDHGQYPVTVLTRTAVHMRAGLVALAACQSKVA
jgi:hypothetical protein